MHYKGSCHCAMEWVDYAALPLRHFDGRAL